MDWWLLQGAEAFWLSSLSVPSQVLLAIVMANPQFALAPERRDDILGLLRDSLVTVSPSAKSPRLLCLAEVVKVGPSVLPWVSASLCLNSISTPLVLCRH